MSAKAKSDTAEQFVGSVFKFSISTVVSFIFTGAALILSSVFFAGESDKALYGEIEQFIGTSNLIMTLTILGLDQSFIRFFNEPPGRTTSGGLFRLCLYISASTLVVAGLVCSLFFAGPLHQALNFNLIGTEAIPLMFLNALFWMVVRYFTVLYRMEQRVRIYTMTTILMNFSYKLFYLVGLVFPSPMVGMVACSLISWGALAVFCIFTRRRALVFRKSDLAGPAVRVVLPYGLALAPTAIMVTLNNFFGGLYLSFMDEAARGIFRYSISLSNIVTMVQGGFAAFWGAYMFANYKTQQQRIKRVHGYLYLVILVFFALLVAFEDVIFWVLSSFKDAQPIFPLVMLSAVFTILCETTVYGNAIARRPIFDTIGIAISMIVNIVLCVLLTPTLGMLGAAIAIAVADLLMYLFRTLTAQRYYVSINSVPKTIIAVEVAIALALAGTLFTYDFLPKLLCSAAAIVIYCLMYRAELVRLWHLAIGMLNHLFRRSGGGGPGTSGGHPDTNSNGWQYHKGD
ncbi:MAG: hypothetical protein GXY32_08365 [Ruminococcaceae bacterium]|nr:hypothetical protein [Oscillospiraceae bacterium]